MTAAVLTIKELSPAITMAISPARIDESAGTRKVVVTATTNTVSAAPLVVALSLGGTATPSTDYTTTAVGTVAIAAAKRRGAMLVEVTAVDDGVADDGETIVFNGALAGFAVTAATLTIEEPAPAIALAASPAKLDENGGAQAVVVRAAANAAVGSALTVPLRFFGTATTTDYALAGARSITIAAGGKAGSTTLTVTPVDDGAGDDDETIEIGATVAGYSVASTTVRIVEPPPSLELSVSPAALDESAGAQSVVVRAKRQPVASSALVVPLTLGGTATSTDYAVAGVQSITIPANQQSATTTLTFTPVADALADDRETIEIATSSRTTRSSPRS